MSAHEERLLAVLEKIGQVEGQAGAPPPPSETAGPASTGATERAGIPDALAPVTRKNFFAHYETHPVVFDVALLHQYNADWYGWEPATLWREILADFHVSSISDHNKAKIQAVRTLHINEWFWTHWEVFNWITQALNGNIPDFQVIQKPSIAQLVCAIDVASIVRGDEEFNHELQMYVAAAMADEGVFYAPQPLEFCQAEIERLLVETHMPQVLDTIKDVKVRYQQVSMINDVEWASATHPVLHETPFDIQVAKLKVAFDYLKLKRQQLQSQLGLLR